MTYYLDLFSPATYEGFSKSDRSVSGFQIRHRGLAKRVEPGDLLLCYLTKLSRWVGMLETIDGPFESGNPIFYPENDPYVVRFHVKPIIWLPVERAVPIHEDELFQNLSFTKGYARGSSAWAQRLKGSLVALSNGDGALIRGVLERQDTPAAKKYPYDRKVYESLITRLVSTTKEPVPVTVPTQEETIPADPAVAVKEIRESLRIQALLADIGTRMGFTIWLPKADRVAVLKECTHKPETLLDALPFNYDDRTMKTIEQIDVLWLKGRSIQRAFEVEHTTSIYSGLLRMADLLALQPNMDIRLHIVAPHERRDKVFAELQRPVFSLLENQPLSSRCTYISYDSVRDLANTANLEYMSAKVIKQFEESSVED
jgi:hypothetical protein